MAVTRKPAVAGTFYPKYKKDLQNMIGEYLKKVKVSARQMRKEIKAVIVPHAGYLYSGQTAAYVYQALKTKKHVKHVILLGPSHYIHFQGAAQDNSTSWQTPLGKIKLKKLKEISPLSTYPKAHQEEHSLEVQLPFLQVIFKDNFVVSPIVTGINCNYQSLADSILRYLNQGALLIISSDLSHFYPLNTAKQTDRRTIDRILKLDGVKLQKNIYEACGKHGILTLVELAKVFKWKGKLLNYDTSETACGDGSRVVGYAGLIFTS